MDFAKRNPILTTVLALCVVAFAAEVFLVTYFRSQATKASAATRTAIGQLDDVLKHTPAPKQENLDAATKNYNDLKAQLDSMIASVPVGNFTDTPTDAASFANEVNKYVGRMNAAAKAAGVGFPAGPDFGWGLGQYSTAGALPPPAPKIPIIYKQLVILDYLLNTLMSASTEKPAITIETVDRSMVQLPMPAGADTAHGNSDNADSKETFQVPALMTAARPGAVETLGFRIKFLGTSSYTQNFLTELAKFQYPLVVRSIEIQPISGEGGDNSGTDSSGAATPTATGNTGTGNAGTGIQQFIKDRRSEVTIVIEYIKLIPPGGETPATTTAAAGAAPMATPAAAH